MRKFIQELQRRNVIKSALAYLVVAWLLIQVMAIIIPTFDWPENLLRTSIIVSVVCFPFWLLFSWVYEITPEGLKKTKSVALENSITEKTNHRLNYIIITGMILVFTVTVGVLIRSSTNITAVGENSNAAIAPDKSIAVLAFADMSPEKDQEYFSDGISEEILSLLSSLPDLKVISRTSSFSYKGKNLDIRKIGEELNVANILEGSIRKSGNTFRITAQLIDAKTGTHIWSETYDRNMEDIFRVQDEIANKVTQQLKISLVDTPLSSKIVNTDAYTLFLQAGQLYNQVSVESDANAIKLIKESIAIDSSYAPAWTLLSSLYYRAGFSLVTMPMEEAISMANETATKAIALDPKYAKGYLELATVEKASWNFKAASALIDKAMLLAPNKPEVLYTKGNFESTIGNSAIAIELTLKTIKNDPLKKAHFYNLGLYYWMNGEFTNAEESLQHYLIYHPDLGFANGLMGQIQISLGHPEKALEYIEKDPHAFWNLYRKNMAVYAMGNIAEANVLLERLITDWGTVAWPNIADVYAFREEKNEAFKWLELAYEERDPALLEILNYPAMQNLWGDVRWNKFIQKLKLPKDHGFHLD